MRYGLLLSIITLCTNFRYFTSFQFAHYLPPFNDSSKIYQLCTEENDSYFLRPDYYQKLMNFYINKYTLCWTDYKKFVPNKHHSIIWFLKAMTGCEVTQTLISKQRNAYKRDFYFEFIKYSYLMICERGHLIHEKDHMLLASYAGLFKTLYQVANPNRQEICTKISRDYADLYQRCYVPKFSARQHKIQERCNAVSAPLLKFHDVFMRFSKDHCDPFDKFVVRNHAYHDIGRALINDVTYMNIISSNLVAHLNSDSDLPSLVLKTRLLLQHFPLAAIKLFNQLETIEVCIDQIRTNWTETSNGTEINDEEKTRIEMHMCCPFNNTNICDLRSENYRSFAENAYHGFQIEGILLIAIFLNTILLALLLMKTQKNLSTATVLFVFNIMFSNVLFMMSFSFFFVDLISKKPYGSDISEGYHDKKPELIIAETLQTHVFASTEFRKHLVQETLYSLAQNGSLTGLIHLLVLVLVVINRSMAGKSIHLSRVSVISVFACVWILLIASHAMFSTMQMNAIQNLDKFFAILSKRKSLHTCNSKSEYEEIASHCDRTAIFHSFGVYLLRGHTIFTVLFLSASIVIFVITVTYHIKVRRQHDIIHNELRNQSPHLRRERLFHTLIVSIIIFFLSVMGQTYIEIAVFWVDERTDIAKLSKWYHLARILAFVDPVMNPLIVVLRTPALRRQLRSQWTTLRSRASSRTNRSRDGQSNRGESIKKRSKKERTSQRIGKETELMLSNSKTDRPLTRTCSKRRSQNSQTHNSVV